MAMDPTILFDQNKMNEALRQKRKTSPIMYVVRGAHIKCSYSNEERQIDMPRSHGVYINKIPVMRETDNVPGDNIPSFGMCNKTKTQCVPDIIGYWKQSAGKVYIRDGRALTTDSYLVCLNGGIIRFTDSGQDQPPGSQIVKESETPPTGDTENNVAPSIDKLPELVTRGMIVEFGNILAERTNSGNGWQNISQESVDDLNRVLHEYNITDPNRIAHFIGQSSVETWYGRDEGLTEINWSNRKASDEENRIYFNKKYGNNANLGNNGSDTDDGYLYRGAGYLHLTGRYNYGKFDEKISEKFGKDPLILEQGASYIKEAYPWESAGFYWEYRVADVWDGNSNPSVEDVTVKINAALTQLDDRKTAYQIMGTVLGVTDE